MGFKLEGYRDAQRTGVRVHAGLVRPVRVELIPGWVKVLITSQPSGASVHIDGIEVCEATPCEFARRPEDGYPVIVVRKKGCVKYWTTVVLEQRVEMPYSVRLDCRPEARSDSRDRQRSGP